MKNYYIVSVDTVYLHTENIAIRETYQDALEVIKQHSDYTGKKGSGLITKVNDKYEKLFVWMFHDNVLMSKFDYIKNKRVSCCEDTEDEIENRTSVELPCKVGDIVYEVLKNHKPPIIQQTKIEKIIITEKGLRLKLERNSFYETSITSLGKTLFLTEAEALKKLKEVE